MGLASFLEQLVPKRWKNRIDRDDDAPPLMDAPRISPTRQEGVASQTTPTIEPSIRPITQPGTIETHADANGVFQPVSPTALSRIGEPPSPMLFNPISKSESDYAPWHPTDRVKPILSPTAQGGPLSLATAERDALERWRPERKRGVKNTLEGLGRGFLAGGVPGAIIGGVGSVVSPNLVGRMERNSLLDRANQTIERQLGEEGERARVDAARVRPQLEAQELDLANRKLLAVSTERTASNEREALQASLKLHEGIPFDPNDPNDATLIRLANRHGIVIPSKYPTIKPNADREVDGKLLRLQPDGSYKAVYESPDKPDTASFTNEQINANIRAAETEQAKVEQALGDTAPTITRPAQYAGEPPIVERNPIYADLENRRDKLIDDQRRWRAGLKPVASSSRVVKPARDGKFHYTPEQIRSALKPGQNYEDIYRQLKANPKVVINEQ